MTKPAEIRIGELSLAHLPQIVEVHIKSFPRSAMTRLGPTTVRRYYEWQFIGPHQAHYLGAWVSEKLGGFCFCGIFRGALGGFLARNRWFLALQVLGRPRLWADPKIRLAVAFALRLLKYRSRPAAVSSPTPAEKVQGHFGILSIAVAPDFRRLGLGARLMDEAERIARLRDFQAMGLTVEPDNETAIRFYEKLGWARVLENGSWRGSMQKQLVAENCPPPL